MPAGSLIESATVVATFAANLSVCMSSCLITSETALPGNFGIKSNGGTIELIIFLGRILIYMDVFV